MENNFVTFDHQALTITVHFQNQEPLVVRQHDPWLKISHFSGGHGGQNVNKHEAGVRLIYQVPPQYRRQGIRTQELMVRCMEQRHQHQNLIAAFKYLAAKLRDYFYVHPKRNATHVPFSSKVKRLDNKKHQSYKKAFRQKGNFEL